MWRMGKRLCCAGLGCFCAGMAMAFELGVIVEHPYDQLDAAHWRVLEELGATAEILLVPGAATAKPAERFTDFEAALSAYADRGIPVAVTLTPHLPDTAWRSEIDETGRRWEVRQNIFDPEFRAAWRRYHEDFVAVYGQDDRIRRVYVAPPSYFGEVEYFMGLDWSDLKVVAYGELGKQAFRDWLQERYSCLAALNRVWGEDFAAWEEVNPPYPDREATAEVHRDLPWLDFMQWRRDYMIEAMAGEMEVLAEGSAWELSFKYSHGDSSMTQGTDSAALLARLRDLPRLTLHMTNPHSLADQAYTRSNARLYGRDKVMVENDGNRYTRTELEKIVFTGLLSSIEGFNFSSYRHLLNTGLQPTQVPQGLRDLQRLLETYRPTRDLRKESPHPIAFYHSNSSSWVRPPHYHNYDVSRVYDAALSNGPGPEVRGFDWARELFNPDVIGEQHILDGGLENRHVLVVPSSGPMLWPEQVLDTVMDWVRDGGTLVGFGLDCFAWTYRPAGDAGGVTHNPRFPGDTGAWEKNISDLFLNIPLPLELHRLDEGQVFLFKEPVPGPGEARDYEFYRIVVPRQLILRVRDQGAGLPLTGYFIGDEQYASMPVNIGYAGQIGEEGRGDLFVAGAYSGEPGMLRLKFYPQSADWRYTLLLIGVPGVVIQSDDRNLEVERNTPSQHCLYQDPTNHQRDESSLFPVTQIRFNPRYTLTLLFNN